MVRQAAKNTLKNVANVLTGRHRDHTCMDDCAEPKKHSMDDGEIRDSAEHPPTSTSPKIPSKTTKVNGGYVVTPEEDTEEDEQPTTEQSVEKSPKSKKPQKKTTAYKRASPKKETTGNGEKLTQEHEDVEIEQQEDEPIRVSAAKKPQTTTKRTSPKKGIGKESTQPVKNEPVDEKPAKDEPVDEQKMGDERKDDVIEQQEDEPIRVSAAKKPQTITKRTSPKKGTGKESTLPVKNEPVDEKPAKNEPVDEQKIGEEPLPETGHDDGEKSKPNSESQTEEGEPTVVARKWYLLFLY